MLQLKTKKELATEAFKLASGNQLVRYRNVTYIPADFETLETSVVPAPERTIWLPLNRARIQQLAAIQFDTLFSSDGELSSFDFMVAQNARLEERPATSLLVRTPNGLQELDEKGQLVTPDQTFRPNTLLPMLNTDTAAKEKTFAVIEEWLNSEEEAHSLLYHLATCLAPGYSAVKYVILLGEGRNGKSVLLKMMQSLFGRDNVSTVTRQQIAEQNPVVTELNGKLVNIVFDGRAEYLKDSGTEKSLIAGELVPIRKLYESTPTMVQTNALFIEGLNREPKSNDKSVALQKRLVRFQFPNIYALDHAFEKSMLSAETLGAFLALLIDHYVCEDDVAVKLAPTTKAIELQLEHMYVNSMGLQFLKYIEETGPEGTVGLLGQPIADMAKLFQSWRLKENDLGTWAEPDVVELFKPLVNTERKSQRINGSVRKVRVVTSFKTEAAAFIESLEGSDADAALLDALVDD
jgi:phage/plasmid-associated DNA primase